MQKVPLKYGGFALVDDEDYALVLPITWRAVRSAKVLYAHGSIKGRSVLMHRLIMGAPKGLVVDHINHDGLDNRRINLRICTHQQNLAYQRKSNRRSNYKGVYPRGNGTFQAIICVNYKTRALGTFPTEQEAALAYDKAAREAHGEFAYPNFPEPV